MKNFILPLWIDVGLLPLLNLCLAFLVAGIVIFALGVDPFQALGVMVKGAFFYDGGVGYTLYYATNFIFTGLAAAVAFHALLFNIGGEGQAYLGGLGIALVCLYFGSYFSSFILIPLAIIASAFFGMIWALIPAFLQAFRGSHVVITTIMFNFIAGGLMVSLLTGPLMRPNQSSPVSKFFHDSASLPDINSFNLFFGTELTKSPLNFSFLIAVFMCFFVWFLIWRTRFGYCLRVLGKSKDVAIYAGINVKKIIIITMGISGAIAGLMSVNEILGVQHRLILNFTAGYGFTGIAVALMGRNHPFGIFLSSILFGALYQGGTELDFEFNEITRDMVVLIQGLIILFSGALAHMLNPLFIRLVIFIQKMRF